MTSSTTPAVAAVASVFNGKTPSKSQQRESGHPVLKIKDVDELGAFRGRFSGHVDPAIAEKHVTKQLVGGETLILNAAHSATHVASKTFFAGEEVTGSLATGEWLIVRWDEDKVDPRFGNHWVNAPETRFRLRLLVKGIHLYPKDVARLPVPLPPLAEQKRIAEILDAADALRAQRREALAQLDTLLQSTFLELFGDPVTNPMGWDVKMLGKLGSLNRGVSKHRPRNEPSLLGGPHPLIQTGAVANCDGYIRAHTSTYSDLGLNQSKMWPAGTLCITIAANIANTGILTFDACFPDSVVGFLSGVEGRVEYVQGLFWFFREILERRAPQVAQKNINLKILRGLPVPVPPDALQRRFASIVEAIEQGKATQRAHLAELDTLFASLQSRAFQGDL